MLNQTAYSSEAFVVGDQKVCILSVLTSNFFKQTFWNTNNGREKRTDSDVKVNPKDSNIYRIDPDNVRPLRGRTFFLMFSINV